MEYLKEWEHFMATGRVEDYLSYKQSGVSQNVGESGERADNCSVQSGMSEQGRAGSGRTERLWQQK